MQYKLNSNGKGYLVERQSIFCDIMHDIELPIILPSNYNDCDIIARIVDSRARSNDFMLTKKDDTYILPIPKYMILPQVLNISIHISKHGVVINSFELEPLRILSFGAQVELKRIIAPALIEQYETEIATLHDFICDIKNNIATLIECNCEKDKLLKTQQEKISQLQGQLNILADVQQTTIKQIALIENNYSIIETIGGGK